MEEMRAEHTLQIYFDELGQDRDTPEHRLLSAVVIRAMLDFVSRDVSLKTAKKRAKKFFDPDYHSEDPFSFWWCCHHLFEDEDRLMAGIRALLVRAEKDPTLLQMRVAL